MLLVEVVVGDVDVLEVILVLLVVMGLLDSSWPGLCTALTWETHVIISTSSKDNMLGLFMAINMSQ